MRPDQVCDTIALTLQQSGRLPAVDTYLTVEAGDEHVDITLPYIEVRPIDVIRARTRNTDFVGYETDDQGNQIGKIYYVLFEMSAQIDIWTVRRGPYDPYAMGGRTRKALYKHDAYVEGEPFTDAEGQTIDDISWFSVGDGERRDDLTTADQLGRWIQEVDIHFNEVVNTAIDYEDEIGYILTVNVPGDDSAVGDDATIEMEPNFSIDKSEPIYGETLFGDTTYEG